MRILIKFFFLVLISCNKSIKNENCLNTNKTDSLIQKIVLITDMYRSLPDQDDPYKCILSPHLKLNSEFYLRNYDTIYVVPKNIASKDKAGTLLLDEIKFNNDSSEVNVVSKYLISGLYHTTTTYITLRYNNLDCNWSIISESTDVH